MTAILEVLAAFAVSVVTATVLSVLRKWWADRSSNHLARSLASDYVEVVLRNPEEEAKRIASKLGPPKVFIAHSHSDLEYARRLSTELQSRGLRTWFAEEKIRPGDNLEASIKEGLGTSGYAVALVSEESLKSKWTAREIEWALKRESRGSWPRVIPVLLDNVALPVSLEGKRYVDFRTDYAEGIDTLLSAIKKK